MLFNLTDQLCTRYSSLNPFIIRKEKWSEVMLLIQRIKKSSKRQSNQVASGESRKVLANGDVIIRRPANNNDWY
ncbi:MAG: hypothetical protein ACLRVU_09760 [Beduini sp.]